MKWILVSCYIVSVVTAADIDVLTQHDMESSTPNLEGWELVGSFDSNADKTCPSPLQVIQINGMRLCQIASYKSGCSSLIYPSPRPFNRTLGMVRGYQKGTTDGFRANRDDGYGINDPYADGVSITMGSPRKHVWTYVSGLTSASNYPNNNCPCATTPGPSPPSFVGKNYYCSSATQNFPAQKVYTENPLWQEFTCTDYRDNCCANVGMPWFYREFPTTQENVKFEIRICFNQPYSDEAILIDKLALYVQ